MSGVCRWRKLKEVALETSKKGKGGWRSWHSELQKRCFVNCLHVGSYVKRRESLIWVQERYKWDHGGSSGDDRHQTSRRIRAEANCPRCSSKQMDLTHRPRHLIPPPPPDSEEANPNPNPPNNTCKNGSGNGFQAVNLCPNCKTAYYFSPSKTSPLQGTFIEIGRAKSNSDKNNKLIDPQDYDKRSRPSSFWETLRSYGSEPPPPPSGNGIAVLTPPSPPFAPGLKVIRASPGNGNGNRAGDKTTWGGSNPRKKLPTPKEISQGLDKFVIGQERSKKVPSLYHTLYSCYL